MTRQGCARLGCYAEATVFDHCEEHAGPYERSMAFAEAGEVLHLTSLPCSLDNAPETIEEARLRVVRTEILGGGS